jgi:tight adherence protein C
MMPLLTSDTIILSILVLAAFFAASTFTMVLTTSVDTPAKRLARYARHTGRRVSTVPEPEQLSLRERVFNPLAASLARLIERTAPQRQHKEVAVELVMAGSRVSPTAFMAVRLAVMFGLPALAVLYLLTSKQIDAIHWVVLLLAFVWGRKVPTMWLKRRIKARQRAIDRRLPYSLDLMVACLEGGLSLDAALVKVVEQSDGPLAAEIRRTLQEMALGRPSAEAIRDLGERTGAPDLKRLTEDIVQADRMGISIAESLRTLARESRVQRRQSAEELARKAPIKMVPVLIFCVLPALGIVTMAPAAILLIRTLSQAGR